MRIRTFRVLSIVLSLFALIFVVRTQPACSPAAKSIADVVVKKLLAECIAENPDIEGVELQKICGFADDLWPIVRDLIAAQKRGQARAAARRQMDAGLEGGK